MPSRLRLRTPMQTTPWLVRQPGAGRRLRLYCFAYAGGSARMYQSWQALVPPELEICAVELPGRAARFHEAPYESLHPLVDALSEVLEVDSSLPYAFFGHSLGGLLAFELARRRQVQGRSLPEQLFVSASAAPRQRTAARRPLSLMDDESLLAELKRYNGTPPEVLANRELMSLYLPTLRADFGLVDGFVYRPGPQLAMPISVFCGTADHHVNGTGIEEWAQETRAGCTFDWFEGDHFFIHAQRQAVLERVQRNCLHIAKDAA